MAISTNDVWKYMPSGSSGTGWSKVINDAISASSDYDDDADPSEVASEWADDYVVYNKDIADLFSELDLWASPDVEEMAQEYGAGSRLDSEGIIGAMSLYCYSAAYLTMMAVLTAMGREG